MSRRVLAAALTTAAVFAQLLLASPARGGGGGCSAPVTDKATTLVRMKQWCFGPTIVHVRKGGKVTWVNRDRDRHNVAGANYLWGSRTLRFKDRITYRFEEKGTYPYLCQYHFGMIGAVVVGNGKATESLTWRDKAINQTDFDRHEGKAGTTPGNHDSDPPASGAQPDPVAIQHDPFATQPDPDPAPASAAWPVEWFVVLAAGILVCVLAVGLALRRGARPATN